MVPLTLAQDRLARGQHPGSTNPPSNRSRPGLKSPVKSRTAKGLPANDGRDRRQLQPESKEEPVPGAKENEMWEETQRRQRAAILLGSWELVTWYAIAGDESIPQTTLRLKRMQVGIPDDPADVRYEDERNLGDDESGHSSSKHTGSSPQNKSGSKRKH